MACTVLEQGRGRLRSNLHSRSAGVELGGRLFSLMMPSGHGPTRRDGRGTCICGRTSSCCQHRTSPPADAVAADRTNLDEHDLQARGSLFLHRRLPSCGLSLLWALPPLCNNAHNALVRAGRQAITRKPQGARDWTRQDARFPIQTMPASFQLIHDSRLGPCQP